MFRRRRIIPLESSTGDQRIHFALVPLDFPGVLILGGENPRRPEESHITADIYLRRRRRLAPLAIPLAAARSRLESLMISALQDDSVYILGGGSPPDGETGFADIEVLRISNPKRLSASTP